MITRPVSAARWIALDTSEHYVTVMLARGRKRDGLPDKGCATPLALPNPRWIHG